MYQKQITYTLQRIKPRYQKVLTLRFFSELELDEISSIMKLNKKNTSVLIFRAAKSFKKKFKKLFPESEIF